MRPKNKVHSCQGRLALACMMLLLYFLAACSESTIPDEALRQAYNELELAEEQLNLIEAYKACDEDCASSLFAEHRFAFQSVIDALVCHALFLRWDGQISRANAQIDLAKNIAADYATHLGDDFFLRTVQFADSLRDQAIRQKLSAHLYYGKGRGYIVNNPDSAEYFFHLSFDFSSRAGDRALQLDNHSQLQFIQYRRDENTQAIALGDTILQGACAIGYIRREIAAYYNNGMAKITLGDNDSALVQLQKGLKLAEQTSDEDFIVQILGRIGVTNHNLGDSVNLISAEAAFERALAIAKKNHKKGEERNLLNDLSQLKITQGLYSEARDDLTRAYALAKETGDLTNAFIILFNLADINSILGDFPRAEEHLKSALALSDTFALAYFETARFHKIYGNLLLQQDKVEEAVQHYNAAIDILNRNISDDAQNDPKELRADLWYRTSTLHAAESNWSMAFDLCSKALNAYAQMQQNIKSIMAQQHLGFILREQKKFAQAIAYLEKSLEAAQALDEPSLLFTAHYYLALVHRDRGDADLAERCFTDAIRRIEKSRAQVTDDERMGYFATMQHVFDDVIVFFFEQGRYQEAFHFSEQSRARSIRELFGQDYVEGTNSTGSVEDVSREIAADLDPNIQVVEYKMTPGKLLIFVLSNGHLYSYSVAIGHEEMQQQVNRFLEAIAMEPDEDTSKSGTFNANTAYRNALIASKRVHDTLIAPIAGLLDSTKIIYFVPEDILFQLPFTALTESSTLDARFLVEKYTVATIQSVHLLRGLIAIKKPAIPLAEMDVLAVGNPTGDLLEAEKEVRNMKKKLGSAVEIATRKQATEPYVMGRLEQRELEIFHVASHAKIDQRFPLKSYLALYSEHHSFAATGSRAIDGQVGDASNGLLTAGEIAEMDLSHIRLCNLAACKTAGGRLYRGEGIVGLNWAFMKAGVSSVMSSLWDVDDYHTRTIMNAFYHYWLKRSLNIAEALRRAQLEKIFEMRNDTAGGNLPHPRAWAAFALYGDYHAN